MKIYVKHMYYNIKFYIIYIFLWVSPCRKNLAKVKTRFNFVRVLCKQKKKNSVYFFFFLPVRLFVGKQAEDLIETRFTR